MNRTQTKIPINVSFRSIQQNNEQSEVTEFSTKGILYRKDNGDYLKFDEEAKEGSVHTVIKVKEREASIIRKGSISMNQLFIQKETTVGTYRTPYGLVEIETMTNDVTYKYNEKSAKGYFSLTYKMIVHKEEIGEYKIEIDFEGRSL